MAELKRRLCLLGATGSVGQATLSIVREHSDKYDIDTLAANSNAEKMVVLCRQFHPARAVLVDEKQAMVLAAALVGDGIAVEAGQSALLAAATTDRCCTVVAAIAGADGVEPALAAARAGKRLLLANKEAIIMAGELLLEAVRLNDATLLPIDSEHCALFDLLAGGAAFKTLWLTASGGAVRDIPLAGLDQVLPTTVLQHPNWSMGQKITVDSATMMNKALEVIEAALLFRVVASRVGVVMHRQSIFHALVEYIDGSMSAGLSRPDMRLPIARMLAWPDYLPAIQVPPSWQLLSEASFAPIDHARYPCLALAYQAAACAGSAPAALSAANEVAVARFLAGEIKFTDIARINEDVLQALPDTAATTMEMIWQSDKAARRLAMRPLGG